MEKKTIRSGIVGAGFSAKFHFEFIKRVHSTNAEIAGIFDINAEQGSAYARERGIRFYKTLEKLLDKVDVIHVCTPPVVHEPIAVSALERNIFAIVEKPLTGYFGDGSDDFNGDTFPQRTAPRNSPA